MGSVITNPKKKIVYLGKSYSSGYWADMTDEEYHEIVDNLRKKPDVALVEDELRKLAAGNLPIGKIWAYFFKNIAFNVKIQYSNWTINEALDNKEIVGIFLAKIRENPKTFPNTKTVWENIDRAIQLGGSGVCSRPTNFPLKVVDMLLAKYCPEGGNYMDYSCGWGVRMLGALRNKRNYFGIDPNTDLFNALNECKDMYQRVNGVHSIVDIRCTGSEFLQEDWIGKMDFCFSSPPYFSLEDYRVGENQSYKEGETTYEDWLLKYARPTVANCFKYLKPGGYFAFNIKNVTTIKQDMERDWVDAARRAGFVKHGFEELVNITRVGGARGVGEDVAKKLWTDNNEIVRIFRKPE